MPQRFQHYTLATSIERRTASATYLASHDDRPTQTVVLKLLHKPTFTNLVEQEKFLLETEKLNHLNHMHIVPLLEAGVEEEQAYLVSKYIPGGSLRVRLDRSYPQQLAFPQALTIITQIGQALTYLHARYLIHGQIKPEHILFDATGRALLSDPYCSTSPAPWDIRNENASNTFRYLAPEQFANKSSASSDQYALCCVAYELLTGRPPFTLRDPQELAEQQKYVVPMPPSQLVTNLPITIEQVILKGLEKDPAQRHADIAAFLAALQPVQASIAIPDLPLPRSKRQTASLAPSIPTSPPPPSKTATEMLPDNADEDLQGTTALPAPQSVTSVSDTNTDADLDSEDRLSEFNIQNDPTETLEELLQNMAIEEELLIATNKDSSPSRPAELYDTVSQTFATTSSVLEDVAIPATSTQTPPDVQAGTSPVQQELVMRSSTSPFSQLLSRRNRTLSASATTSRPSASQRASIQNWQPATKRIATIMVWALVIILIVGSLVTYTALASTTPKSSSLALLAATSTPRPTPQPTIDQSGILPQTTSKDTLKEPKPTPKPTPTPIPTPYPTPIPVYIPATAPTPYPTPTPKPVAAPATMIYSNTLTAQSTQTNTSVFVTLPGLILTDSRIEADIVTNGDGGGIIFRSGYRFRVGTNGTYDLVTPQDSLASSSSSAIKQGNGTSNHVTIVTKGQQITISVNSQVLINIQNNASKFWLCRYYG